MTKKMKSYKDGSYYLNIIPCGSEYTLTSCLWDAQDEIKHGSGQVLTSGTFEYCDQKAKALLGKG